MFQPAENCHPCCPRSVLVGLGILQKLRWRSKRRICWLSDYSTFIWWPVWSDYWPQSQWWRSGAWSHWPTLWCPTRWLAPPPAPLSSHPCYISTSPARQCCCECLGLCKRRIQVSRVCQKNCRCRPPNLFSFSLFSISFVSIGIANRNTPTGFKSSSSVSDSELMFGKNSMCLVHF